MHPTVTAAVPTPHLSLYDWEHALPALLDLADEDEAPPELHGLLLACLEGALDKRDRVAQFLAHLEAQQEFAEAEIKRLRARKERFARAQERLERQVIAVLRSTGAKRLEGRTSTLSLRACPPSVAITDGAAVPAAYKVRHEAWTVDRPALRQALERGEAVPGATLITGKQTLVRR